MIQWMHRLSQSWVATILMGGLALSFVVWGIADIFTGASSTSVATIGSTQIDSTLFQRDYRNYLRQQSQQMGTEITPEMAQKMNLGETALRQLISRTAIDNEVARQHLTVSTDALQSYVWAIPAFQGLTGKFDHDRFLSVMQQYGYTEQEYLNETRTDLARDQMVNALARGFALPEGYTKALFLFVNEGRAVDYVVVTPDALGAIAPPSDAVLAAYVKAHPEQFSSPEYRDVAYAQIGPQDLTSKVTITEAAIAQDYDTHKATYQVPEKRDIQQIEFATQADAQAAYDRIKKGESFEKLAAERKISPAELDLGTLSKAELGSSARADAAFALKQNEVSAPVQGTIGGAVLLRVVKIVPAINKSLAEVHDAIKNNLALQQAGGKLVDIINAFEDARSGGADIPTAAKKAGMTAGRIASVDKNGLNPAGEKIPGLPADPEFLTQAFAVEEGEDNDPFQAKSGEYYAVKVSGHIAPKLRSLDAVRGAATAAWLQEQRGQALMTRAAQLAGQAVADKGLTGIAKALKGAVQHSAGLTRQTNDAIFTSALVQRIFALPPGGIQMGPEAAGTNYVIVQLTGISHAVTPQTQATAETFKGQLSQQAAGDLPLAFANAAQQRQGVKIDQRVLQSVIGSGQ